MRTKLYTACLNNHGFFDVAVGTDMTNRLSVSSSTINRWLNQGWLKRIGSRLVLTKKGYSEC